MPYVDPADRDALAPHPALHADDVGALNFQITTLIDEWLSSDVRYESINAAIGVLECAKLELYRRIAAPYEDKKCKLNGDVYRSAGEATRPFGRLAGTPAPVIG